MLLSFELRAVKVGTEEITGVSRAFMLFLCDDYSITAAINAIPGYSGENFATRCLLNQIGSRKQQVGAILLIIECTLGVSLVEMLRSCW